MAYVPSELRLLVPNLMSNGGGLSGTPQMWSLQGNDAHTAADAAGFVSDAGARGMRVGDIVFYTQWADYTTKASLTNVTMHVVAAITAGAADLSNIASVTMTNTD
jgi:hypothetical protein